MADDKPSLSVVPFVPRKDEYDEILEESRANMCAHLDEIKDHLMKGMIDNVVIVTDGEESPERLDSQYNIFRHGDMSRAEIVGLLMMGVFAHV